MDVKRKALIEVINSTAEVVQDFRSNVCKKCTNEILCYPGSINPSRIKACESSSRLVKSFMGLIETGVVKVHSNLSLTEIDLDRVIL